MCHNSLSLMMNILSKDRFYPRDVVSGVFATATWLAVWLDVTRRYCIKTAKPI